MTADVESLVLTDVRGTVGLVTLNRPDRLNAVTGPMVERLSDALHELDQNPDVTAVVLTGAGRGFCAGADTAGLATMDPVAMRESAVRYPRDRAMRLSKPLIAAVNGPVAGVGLSFALMADVRFASSTATATTAFARYGLVAEHGISFLLKEVVGRANALDLLLSSRKIDADEGYRMGLFQFLASPDDVVNDAIAYAEKVSKNSAYSLAQIKEQVLADAGRDWADAYRDSTERMAASLNRAEFSARASARAVAGREVDGA